MQLVLERLAAKHRANDCRSCWTSCRGAIETMMHGDRTLSNIHDYYQLTKRIPLMSSAPSLA